MYIIHMYILKYTCIHILLSHIILHIYILYIIIYLLYIIIYIHIGDDYRKLRLDE